MDLNAQQQQAVEAPDGPVLIMAGPGTGKTKTLTARISHLIKSGRAQPAQILALTFTKKAAQEMQKRLAFSAAPRPQVTTFHALCYKLLRAQTDQPIAFVSEPQRLAVIKSAPKPSALKHLSSRELGLLISRAKNSPEEAEEAVRTLTNAYNAALHQQNLYDFDDLLLRTYELLKSNKQARLAAQARFSHILVDEFQDTNRLQYKLLHLLRSHDNLFVIGDPMQSIYGFRGASGDIFERFKADFPRHCAIALTTNYRSAPEVVGLSNALFGGTLKPHIQAAGRVRAVQVLNEYSEANWILGEIQRGIGGSDLLRAVSDDTAAIHRRFSDFAIIYRSRSAALVTQRAVAESGLPYQIAGEGSPYEQPQVQALISLLKAYHCGQEVEIKGFSKAQCQALLAKVPQTKSPQALAQHIVAGFGFELTSALTQFLNTLVRFASTEEALQHLDAIAQRDFYDASADAITLLTIHAAKGLEFPYVFLIGAEEGALPHSKADPEEEQRLFYVAVTRAQRNLDILHARFRGGKPASVSRFISGFADDILPKSIDPQLHTDQRRTLKRQVKRAQTSLF